MPQEKIKDIVIIGSGGLAKEVALLITEGNKVKKKYRLLGFVGKEKTNKNSQHPVIMTDLDILNWKKPLSVAFGIGSSEIVATLVKKYSQNLSLNFPNLYHPSVLCDRDQIKIGQGNIFCANVILTVDIKIGSFNYFNLCVTVGHDAIIGNFNMINPSVNISGGVKINNNVMIGTGTQILQYKNINSFISVGAGSVVTKNLDTKGVYLGIPARIKE